MYVRDLGVFPVSGRNSRNEVRIGQEAHIEDQVRLERHAVFVAEADEGRPSGSWPSLLLPRSNLLRMNARSSCTLCCEVSTVSSAILRIGSSRRRSASIALTTVSVRPDGCGRRVSENRRSERRVRRLEEKDLRRQHLAQLAQQVGKLVQPLSLRAHRRQARRAGSPRIAAPSRQKPAADPAADCRPSSSRGPQRS